MPALIQRDTDNLFVLHFSGVVKRADFGLGQQALARDIDAGGEPRILAILDHFEGWERGADWNDLDFQLSHGSSIAKIAIVGDKRWEAESLAFAGAGFRRAPVQFFPVGQESAARAWLSA